MHHLNLRHLVFVGVTLLFSLALFMRPSAAALECTGCHGVSTPPDIRPLDTPVRDPQSGGFPGSHRPHLPLDATKSDCLPCHPGSDSYTSWHRDGEIRIAFPINGSPLPTTYRNQTTHFPQRSNPVMGSCSNVNCHFEGISPVWGGPALPKNACSSCHAAPPTDGSHVKKHADYFGQGIDSCRLCHPDHRSDPDPLSHALETGKRPLDVRFTTPPNNGGGYTGDVSYPRYLPSQNSSRNGTCTTIYCHSDGRGGVSNRPISWSAVETTRCYFCHKGRTADNNQGACLDQGGSWNVETGLCTPYVNMTSNGHGKLVGPQWIRKYPCSYCHAATVDNGGSIIDPSRHVNGVKDVVMDFRWSIPGKPLPTYDPQEKVCDNVYCHSDGSANPDGVRPFAWTEKKTDCNTCHGHPRGSCSNAGCHDGRTDTNGTVWVVKTGWPVGEEWKAAIPMYTNGGAGTQRANSHARHIQTNFTCDQCHNATVKNGVCTDCHSGGIPPGSMGESAHLDGTYHVNKAKDVVFKEGGTYNPLTKTCSNTACHTGGVDPQWGASVKSTVICLSCHGVNGPDVDSFSFAIYSTQGKINLTEWVTTGHGRPASAGPYPVSGNPPANFPGNPCWYCHDNNVIHNDPKNPFRLRQHPQFANRYEKECVYCHMVGVESECRECHDNQESLAPQLSSPLVVTAHGGQFLNGGCRDASCHDSDQRIHRTGAGFWTPQQQADVRFQYLMMGVCLKCHDDDSGDKCTSCHVAPPGNPFKYSLGFDPGTGFIKPQRARASSVHFGYKHYREYTSEGVWKGGKFCWDCHDPHGDSNIYMIQSQVATTTDGIFGIPRTRSKVTFTRKQSGLDYARISAPYDGICNVCHASNSRHYRKDGGDGHNASRVCTSCHEHRFTDSHADKQACATCHQNKPVPRHTAFGLPRNCTKCHAGTINKRADIMGQMNANSHHVQGVEVTNRHCYACHWEATPEGLIDTDHHQGFNYRNYSTVKNAPVDLVVWKPGSRPTLYNMTTAVQFLASRINTADERSEVAKLNRVCLSCHSDQNNDTTPFNDCKTPRQYAWDGQSIAARYGQTGTTTWGKYDSTTFPRANQKDRVTKALSAHGNAVANQGGYSQAGGVDENIPNTRNGLQNVMCYDCHNSHGSKANGTTSSYVTFNGTRNGGNLKETQAGKGGYPVTYKPSSNTAPGAFNPYNAGAGLCFDCHTSPAATSTPWGYQSTYGATAPIKGYFDSTMFGETPSGERKYAYKGGKPMKGGHFRGSSFLNVTTSAADRIGGLCTPCHDPHGVSPTLGDKQGYAVPMLKGTWLTSPYREDGPQMSLTNPPYNMRLDLTTGRTALEVNTDQWTFNGSRITEDAETFGGLCLRCHKKENLTNGTNHTWKSKDRVHESVKGWKSANGTIQHSYSCSKCHTPHVSELPRLMVTNCLDFNHRGGVASGGTAGSNSWIYQYARGPKVGSFPKGVGLSGSNCHPTGTWPDNSWNQVTPW
ncbi:MAG: hypothetical protein Fur0034_12970 [Desulfuromonadia bacterium]